jgi:hypothetical protein
MLTLFLPTAVGAISGALASSVATRLWLRRREDAPTEACPLPPDPDLSAQIERTAAAWATSSGRPEASGIVADKLHLLHHLAQRRGRRDR